MYEALFQPASIGSLTIPNRFIRAATAETMAADDGSCTPQLAALYGELASHNVGLMFTGNMFVHRRGRSAWRQPGIHDDSMIDSLSTLPEAVHQHDGRIFAQLGHAGSQSRVIEDLLSPDTHPNPLTGRSAERAADESEIEVAIEAFAQGARRAADAGFDGVHIHGANGYLISSFTSPYSNRRTDGWGGDQTGRTRFACEVAAAVRRSVPPGFPVTMKLGFWDAPAGGVSLDEAVDRAVEIAGLGVDAIEVSSNLIAGAEDSARRLVGVGQGRALADLILERVRPDESPEAYFLPYARALKKKAPEVPVILVGGIRSLPVMSSLVSSREVDFLSMARPFIREPDLVEKLKAGRSVSAACTSCNLCYERGRDYSLRCWRKPRRYLLLNAGLRIKEALALHRR
ncbi:MAG: NADH:flavin oxidoreductase [Actinobacteria bacterium]|nr:NADH:flavin oxidoreductase [Actinomycetota bacterium]